MAANCYWCETGTAPGSIPNPVGARGEPLGCCIKCQVFSCGEHAQRDRKLQEFKCFDCLFIKLVTSGLNQVPLTTEDKALLQNWDRVFFAVLPAQVNDFFSSFEDFKQGSPGYKGWFDEIERTSLADTAFPFPVSNIFRDIGQDGKLFFVAAAVIQSQIEGVAVSVETSPFAYYLLTAKNGLRNG